MLAIPGPVPDDPGWAFEFAWDGVRALADVGPDHVRLVIGGKHGITTRYPELDALPALARRRMLLDGKIVALDACGRPSMSRLQHRMGLQHPSGTALRRVPVVYYVFDLLRLDDLGTLTLTYLQRRELLEELELAGGPIVLPPYFPDTDGHTVLNTAAEYGLHGVVAKRADSTYQPGRRSRSWVQTALRHTQEVVIGGWMPARNGPAGRLGSLLVGLPTEAGLRYGGQVSVGLTDAVRGELDHQLAELTRPTSPFVDQLPLQTARAAQWVAPALLGEVSYRRWTSHGRLAHPAWAGLRQGKHPAAVQTPVVLGPPVTPTSSAPGSPVVLAASEPSGPEPPEQGELAEAVRRAQAEVRALRIQISPHFLYNALSAISALVRSDPNRARELLMEFAGFTRYAFRAAPEFVTLADEIENIERYLALEQARLDARLRVTMQIAPQVLPVILPFLALQLVVESAVRNGVEVIPGGGEIAIHAVGSGTDCLITVAVEGPGPAAHADLGDVDHRLRSAFGAGYRLQVQSTDPRSAKDTGGPGTTITLRVPRSRG